MLRYSLAEPTIRFALPLFSLPHAPRPRAAKPIATRASVSAPEGSGRGSGNAARVTAHSRN